MKDQTACNIVVHGRVQGVGFRYSCREQARRLGIYGWVNNCMDGSVACRAQGEASAMSTFLAWLHEGPPGARVEQVVAASCPVDPLLRDFSIRYE